MIPTTSIIFVSKMEENILSSIKKRLFIALWFQRASRANTGNSDSRLGIARTMGTSSGLPHVFLGCCKLTGWDIFQKLIASTGQVYGCGNQVCYSPSQCLCLLSLINWWLKLYDFCPPCAPPQHWNVWVYILSFLIQAHLEFLWHAKGAADAGREFLQTWGRCLPAAIVPVKAPPCRAFSHCFLSCTARRLSPH